MLLRPLRSEPSSRGSHSPHVLTAHRTEGRPPFPQARQSQRPPGPTHRRRHCIHKTPLTQQRGRPAPHPSPPGPPTPAIQRALPPASPTATRLTRHSPAHPQSWGFHLPRLPNPGPPPCSAPANSRPPSEPGCRPTPPRLVSRETVRSSQSQDWPGVPILTPRLNPAPSSHHRPCRAPPTLRTRPWRNHPRSPPSHCRHAPGSSSQPASPRPSTSQKPIPRYSSAARHPLQAPRFAQCNVPVPAAVSTAPSPQLHLVFVRNQAEARGRDFPNPPHTPFRSPVARPQSERPKHLRSRPSPHALGHDNALHDDQPASWDGTSHSCFVRRRRSPPARPQLRRRPVPPFFGALTSSPLPAWSPRQPASRTIPSVRRRSAHSSCPHVDREAAANPLRFVPDPFRATNLPGCSVSSQPSPQCREPTRDPPFVHPHSQWQTPSSVLSPRQSAPSRGATAYPGRHVSRGTTHRACRQTQVAKAGPPSHSKPPPASKCSPGAAPAACFT